MVEIIYQLGKGYLLAATPVECNRMVQLGINIVNANRYGLKAVRSRANMMKSDNLRKKPRLKKAGLG